MTGSENVVEGWDRGRTGKINRPGAGNMTQAVDIPPGKADMENLL